MTFHLDETEENDEYDEMTPDQIADHLVSILKRSQASRNTAEAIIRDTEDILGLYLMNNTSTQRLFD